MTDRLKKQAAVSIPLDVLRMLAEEGWVVDPKGNVTPPEVGKRKLKEVNPVDILELPKIYYYNTNDIRMINGNPCVVLDVKKSGPRTVGFVKVFDTEKGLVEDLPYEGTIEQIEDEKLRLRQSTLEDVNQKVKEYNAILSKIEQSSRSVPTLTPQLWALIRKVDDRIGSLDGIIAAKQRERESGGPSGTKELSVGIDEAVNSGGLSVQDFVDTVLYQYMYRYDELVEKLSNNAIPMPSSANDPEALREALMNVANLAYQEYETSLQTKKLLENYKGRYQELIDDLNNGAIDIPAIVDNEAFRASLVGKAQKAMEKKPQEIKEVELKELREMTLDQIPSPKPKATGYQSIESYTKSLNATIKSCETEKEYLEKSKAQIKELIDYLNGLNTGERSNQFLTETAEGRAVVDQIRQTANDLLEFVKRYKMTVVDSEGNINPMAMGRKGSTGNAIIVISFSKIYNTLSQILDNLQKGIDVFDTEENVVEDIAEEPVEEPAPESELMPQSESQNKIKQMSERLNQAFQDRTWLR